MSAGRWLERQGIKAMAFVLWVDGRDLYTQQY